MFVTRMRSWVSLNIVLIQCLMFNDVSEAIGTALVGTVYCDPCFHQDFTKSSHFISGALVGVGCGGVGRPKFWEEVKTDEKGEFTVKLPFEATKHVNKIKRCSVKLISSSQLDCAVAATTTSSSVWLKVKTPENHVFSAGFFTFQPLEQPKRCHTESHENANDEYGHFGAMTPFPSPAVDQMIPPLTGIKQTTTELDNFGDINNFGFPYPQNQLLPPITAPSFPFQPPPDSMFTPNFQTPLDSTFTPNFQTPQDTMFTPNFQTPPDSMFNLGEPSPDSMFNSTPLQPPPDSIFNPFQSSPPSFIPWTPPPPSFFPSFPFPPLEPQPDVIQSTPPPPPPPPPPGTMPPFPAFPFQPSPGNSGTPSATSFVHLKKTSSP